MSHGTRKKSKARWDRSSREAYWRQHVVGYASSGLTVSEYCRVHGLSTERLYWWRRHVGCGVGRSETMSVEGARFTEVKLPEPALSFPCPLEIVTSGGRTVRVHPGFDAHTLSQVLSVLEERSC
jgi:transposase